MLYDYQGNVTELKDIPKKAKQEEHSDDERDEESYDPRSSREAILFCIELSAQMFQPIDELNDRFQIVEILETVKDLMFQLVMVRPDTGIGCYINGCNRDKGLYELLPLADINMGSMKIINDLLTLFANGTDPFVYFGYKPEQQVSLYDLFLYLQGKSLTKVEGQRPYDTRRIFFITDTDSPKEKSNIEETQRLRRIVGDMAQNYIHFSPFFIGSKEKPFDSSYYADILLLNSDPNSSISNFWQGYTTSISARDIKSRVLQRKEIKRSVFRCPLIFDEQHKFIMGIKCYNIISIEKPGSRYKLAYEDKNVRYEAHSKRKYYDPTTAKEISADELLKVYNVGDLNMEIEENDMLDFSEESSKYKTFLKLIGFRASELCVKYYNNIDKTVLMIPDDSAFEGSTKSMNSLYRTMTAKDRCAVVWGKVKINSNPAIYLMKPTNEPGLIGGFYLWRVPFLDEIRKFPTLATYENVDESDDYQKLLKITTNIIDRLSLKNGYNPEEYRNPALNRHFKMLQDYILQVEYPETQGGSVKEEYMDDTLEKIAKVHQNIAASAAATDPRLKVLHRYVTLWNIYYQKIARETLSASEKSRIAAAKRIKPQFNL